MKAYVLITAKPGTSEEVLNAIKRVKGVVQADSVYGRFDAIVIVEAADVKKIAEIVYKVIEKNPNITHTETALTLT
jgi:DNA-binding Lrp family transcriptional regulator